MDRFLSDLDAVEDGELRLCVSRGIAWQADMTPTCDYGDAYYAHYVSLEGSDVEAKLNAGRCAMLARHVPDGSDVLDYGAGCGTFVERASAWGYRASGYDVMPRTVAKLREAGKFADDPSRFDAVTFWDSLEHIPEPSAALDRIRPGAVILVAIPLVGDIREVRASKHYKPGEHLMHFTREGFLWWMGRHGFRVIEESSHETDAGRESIGAFAFVKDEHRPPLCPCGGCTFVDRFDWPRKAPAYFARCLSCDAMSKETAETAEAAEELRIEA